MTHFPRYSTGRGRFHAPLFFILLGLFGIVIMAVIAAVWAIIRALEWMQQ